ncbi:A-kinase anchor protein 8-like [Mixophyes fleayi]|uniref:A-kinase anchor protein 8-like n=1 Tax=Mixophyes fleayi TaxID=3061075 RepID=UPI003F4DC2CA
MDGRRGDRYLGRDRYPGGEGYDSYDYTYDYGPDPASSCGFVSESWMTSHTIPHRDGATHMGSARDGPYDRADRSRYGYSEPDRGYGRIERSRYGYSDQERGYGSRREQSPSRPAQLGWGAGSMGGFRSNLGSHEAGRGARRPMPLRNPGTFPEMAGFQALRAFTDNSYFGGGFKQRNKKNWKERTAKKKLERLRDGGAPPEKKLRENSEDNGAKSEESESDGDGDADGAGRSIKTDKDDKEEEREETSKDKKEQKQSSVKKHPETQSRRGRERMVDRIQFVCSLCKFRTFYDEEMSSHLQSDFHKEHFDYVGGKLPKQSADFLQEYVLDKSKKTEERRKTTKDLSMTIQQIYRDQDVTQDLGMEHFVKKVEAAHCAACDMFIPMNFTALQRHVKTPLHNQNRRSMMENSKKTALAVARSILNNKFISQKLESYIKGQNPFAEDYDENAKSGIATELAPEGQECVKEDLPSSSALSSSINDESTLPVTTSDEPCDGEKKEEEVTLSDNSESAPDRQDSEEVNAENPVDEEEIAEQTEEVPSDRQ